MPLVYTKEEIKAYLADRGFDTSNEDMINKFIHDLKKMVKYEDRRRRRMRLGHDPQETNLDSTGQSAAVLPGNDRNSSEQKAANASKVHIPDDEYTSGPGLAVTNHLPGHGSRLTQDLLDGFIKTDSTKSRRPHTASVDNARKDQHGSNTPNSKFPVAPSSGRIIMTRKTYKQQNGEAVIEESIVHVGEGSEKRKNRSKATLGVRGYTEKPDIRDMIGTNSNNDGLDDSPKNLRNTDKPFSNLYRAPRSGQPSSQISKINNCSPEETEELLLILGSLLDECDDEDLEIQSVTTNKSIKGPPNSVKRDPVALYHYYKGIWDKQNIPGQSRHMQLRWNVRAQTVGNYPCVDGRPVKYLR